MKREIKFRGKTTLGKWFFGFLNAECVIRNLSDNRIHYCDKSTIGQFTGLKDKNGKEIYEGDIVERHVICESLGIQNLCRIYVHWGESGFVFRDITNGRDIDFNLFDCKYTKVLGNIHDNPELLNQDNNGR